MKYLSSSEKETKDIAQKVVEKIIKSKGLAGPLFIGLVGDLGAGKTTFMKGVAEFFDIKYPIQSPTFVIQKVYDIGDDNRAKRHHHFKRLVHIDMYRLEGEHELSTIRWEAYKRLPDHIVFVEWPNQVFKNRPEDMVPIDIRHGETDTERVIIYEKK